MKKLIIAITTSLIVGGFIGYLAIPLIAKNSSTSIRLDSTYSEAEPPYSDSVACKLKLSAVTEKTPSENKLEASGSVESKWLDITITDINSDKPILISGDGYRADLISVSGAGNEDMVYMVELTDFGNLNVWTLFRDRNMLSLTKQYDMGGPFILSMLGDCRAGY